MKKIIFGLLILLPWTTLISQQKEYLEKKRKETLKEIENTQAILNEVNRSKFSSLDKLKLLDKQINTRSLLLSSLSGEIEFQDKEISEQQNLISKIEGDIVEIKTIYAPLIFAAY
jgi:peptidoglycan hydrolase CwlO-like protein